VSQAADVGPVPAEQRTQPAFDLFLIFAGANIVATTLVTGASLAPAFSLREGLAIVAAGTVLGSALVAALAPVGSRLGVPSVIAARAALGRSGAAALALLLYVTNFAWIALNNVIAASACAMAAGGPGSRRGWAVALGLLSTAVVALGPRAVGRADRVAVPLMVLAAGAMLWRCLQQPASALAGGGDGSLGWIRGLDVVIAYQVSWILMFADYSRYTASGRRSALAVFLGLAVTSLWFMPLGTLAARVAGSPDPGEMIAALRLPAAGAVLMALGTLTTNFVNIYLSALAWKSLFPRSSSGVAVWSIGLVGTALSLFSRAWLDRYADLMLVLGGVLVPVGGILLARFSWMRDPVDVEALYHSPPRVEGPALAAWGLGAAAYFAASSLGGTLPALAVSAISYRLLARGASGAAGGRSR
jgi:purine-cytosine permease-like protein